MASSLITIVEWLKGRHKIDLLQDRCAISLGSPSFIQPTNHRPKLAAWWERTQQDPDWKRVFGEYRAAFEVMRADSKKTKAKL